MIGSRKFSEAGAKLSHQAGKIVAEEGINLVNGLALGCDTEALKGALSVGGSVLQYCRAVWSKFNLNQIINSQMRF